MRMQEDDPVPLAGVVLDYTRWWFLVALRHAPSMMLCRAILWRTRIRSRPHRIRALTDHFHGKGLKLGIYSDTGPVRSLSLDPSAMRRRTPNLFPRGRGLPQVRILQQRWPEAAAEVA